MRLVQPSIYHLLHGCQLAQADEIAQYEAFNGPWDAQDVAADLFRRPGLRFCLIDDDSMPIVIAGYDPVRDGVWESWMIGSADAWQKYGKTITRETRKIMHALLASDAHRLQLTVLASRLAARSWYERALGMTGVPLPSYGRGGEDAVLYSLTREPSYVRTQQ